MGNIFMNSKIVKTSDRHRLILNLSSKLNLKRSDKKVTLSNLRIQETWKNIKSQNNELLMN